METLMLDVRFALRQAWRRPGFAVLFVLVLALGIGSTGAMFAVVRGALLADLPFPAPDRMVAVFAPQPEIPQAPLSGPDFIDWRDGSSSFDALAALAETNLNVVVGDEAIRVVGGMVTGEYFAVLGEEPAFGRLLSEEDDEKGAHVAVISDAFYRERFGGDPAIVGRAIPIDGELYEIVGVLAPGRRFLGPWGTCDIWVPLGLTAPGADPIYTERGSHNFRGLGRLKAGVSPEAAKAELAGIAERLAEAHPKTNGGVGADVMDLKELITGKSRSQLGLLFGAIGFILLLTCANAANLLLARAAGRQGEIAIRAALGASRGRIFRQLLTESLLLSLLAGAVGLLVAMWALDLFVHVLVDLIPATAKVSLDPWSLAFTFGISTLAGVLAGVAPALKVSRLEAYGSLKEGAARSTAGSAKSRLRSALVVAEVTIAIALLCGAGLLLKSYAALQAVDSGFDAERVHTGRVSLPRARYGDPARVLRFQEAVVAELRNTSGVLSAAVIDRLPQGNWGSNGSIRIEGRPPYEPGESPIVERRRVTADYFSTMGIRMVHGRAFTEADTKDAAPVMIVNEAFANRFFPGEDAIGKGAGWNTDNLPFAEIVGVYADVRSQHPEQPAPLESVIPFAQHPDPYFAFVVKTAPGIDGGAAIVAAVRTVDPLQPLHRVMPMEEVSAQRLAGRRSILLLLGAFAAVAIVLASLGIYGVVAHQTAQRTREVGIRLALGARPVDVVLLVVRQSMTVVGIGLALGLAVALGGSRVLGSFLYGTSALDPAVYAAVAGAVGLVALVASFVPARRAAAVAPASALRYE